MATQKYEMEVLRIGPMLSEFIAEGILVFFGEGAPEELEEFAIIHKHSDLTSPVEPGDRFDIDGTVMTVTAVGEVANENIANLGHVVLKANGNSEPEMPGDVCVEALPLPDITVGTIVKVFAAG